MKKYRIIYIPTGEFVNFNDSPPGVHFSDFETVKKAEPLCKFLLLACEFSNCNVDCKNCPWELNIGMKEIALKFDSSHYIVEELSEEI